MTPERWQQVERLLEDAFELAPEARAAFLDGACAGDDALRREVEALLRAEAEAPAFLEEAAADFVAPAMDGLPDASLVGQHLGPFQIVRELGRGGMGTVYLAERADGRFEQQVALKVIKRGMDTDAVVRRFRYEQQILAQLQHAHVARLYDGGVTDDGRPYFVMEYIDGEPLTAYCDRKQLSVAERLQLFETVCDAVRYAHRNLVVHRDLKPSNILVAEEGGVKLLDFGIAKLLDPGDVPFSAPLTQAHVRPMTPEYAAPEQVRGEPVTTATDVYALGVILYELLAGRRPYAFAHRSPTEIERVVCGQVPERPSKAGTRPGPGSVAAAAKRRHGPWGDLDAISLKALKKEPERRYASAADLLDDLRRHREGLPVAARDDTARYRAARFIGRHKTAVTLAALAVLALVAGLVVALWQADVAARERDAGEREAARAREMLDFVVGLFDVVDPQNAQGRVVTAQDLVATGLTRIEGLDAQPEVQATMLDVMGRVSYALGRYPQADSLFQRAVALKRRALGVDHPDLAESLLGLGQVRQLQDSLDAARRLFERAQALQAEAYGPDDPRALKYLNALAFAYFTQARDTLAIALYRALLARRDGPGWRDHPEMEETLHGLARVLDYNGRHDEAEGLFREALALRRARLGPAHPRTAEIVYNLARGLVNQGEMDEAASFYAQALDVYRQAYGAQHMFVANGVYALAQVQHKRGAYAEAVRGYREASTLYAATLPPGNPWRAYPLIALGWVFLEQGHAAQAEAHFRRGLALYEAAPDLDPALMADARHGLGQALSVQGRYAEAEPLLLDSYRVLEKLSTQAQGARRTLRDLAALYRAWGKPKLAAAYAARLPLEAEGEAGK